MNLRELVDHIHSGPAKVVLDEPLRFRRRTRSNPCDFNEFLQALRSSETIQTAVCESHQELGISEDEWVLLVKTVGSIKCIDDLTLCCEAGSRDFRPFQALADALNNARSLHKLAIDIEGETFPIDPLGVTALANALREHTALQVFGWYDCLSHSQLEAVQITAVDHILLTLSACPHLQMVFIQTTCASSDAVKNLLQLRPATDLRLVVEFDQWLAVADEIRGGRCNVQTLGLAMFQTTISEATEAVQAVASAIQLDCNLKNLFLEMENGFTNEAGVALAEALTVNKTLRKITLVIDSFPYRPHRANALGAPAYEAFSAMLRVNTSLDLKLPTIDTAVHDIRLSESHNQIVLEQWLNRVGRGRLLASTNQTTREEWVDALYELNSSIVNDPPAFRVSCLYSLLRLNPSVLSILQSLVLSFSRFSFPITVCVVRAR
jgi:hypothetical protein